MFKSEVIEEAFRGAGEQAISVFNVLRRQDETDKTSDKRLRVRNQIIALMQALPDMNINMNSLEENYFRMSPDGEGAESKIYFPEDKDFIIKAQDFSVQSETPLDYIVNRIIIHNAFFPNAKYELHGFTFDDDPIDPKFRFIVSQDFIKGRAATEEEIEDYMTKLGFESSEHRNWYTNGPFRISDMHGKNVLKFKNSIYVIDEVIDLI